MPPPSGVGWAGVCESGGTKAGGGVRTGGTNVTGAAFHRGSRTEFLA